MVVEIKNRNVNKGRGATEWLRRFPADFVMAIAEHAHEHSPDFGIFTINGEDIGLRYPDYLETVTGIPTNNSTSIVSGHSDGRFPGINTERYQL